MWGLHPLQPHLKKKPYGLAAPSALTRARRAAFPTSQSWGETRLRQGPQDPGPRKGCVRFRPAGEQGIEKMKLAKKMYLKKCFQEAGYGKLSK